MAKGKKIRLLIQLLSVLVSNANLKGFLTKSIYSGKAKSLCLPGLNCYSCPLAVASCPVGAFQAAVNSRKFSFSFYVTGFISLVGLLAGRLVCGYLCPFGFIQDLLFKIPLAKIRTRGKFDRILRFLKYIVLLLFVILIPIFVADRFGNGFPAFCKYICPAGTLEGGIPLVLLNKGLRSSIGFLFRWKMTLLVATLFLSVFIFRPFCKYICPLGAFYSFFNKISFLRLTHEKSKCTLCGKCGAVCPMQIKMPRSINSMECIRCGKCLDACENKSLSLFKLSLDLNKSRG